MDLFSRSIRSNNKCQQIGEKETRQQDILDLLDFSKKDFLLVCSKGFSPPKRLLLEMSIREGFWSTSRHPNY
jgi:hypothetical protein